MTALYQANKNVVRMNGEMQVLYAVTENDLVEADHPAVVAEPSMFTELDAGVAASLVAVAESVFVGMCTWTLRASAGTGWLLCYGQAISRSTYAALFAAIGTAGGAGDGSTTFNVPDLRGRAPFGMDNMGGSDAGRLSWANTLGTTGGTETHTLTSGEMPAHTHNVTTASGVGALGGVTTLLGASQATQATSSTGGGGAHQNMPPAITGNWLIYYGT